MGQFSNGTEGMIYEDHFCSRCVHEDGCPVWGAHLLYNSDQRNNPEVNGILGMLIPRDEQGYNQECAMFHPTPPVKESSDNE